ncbi:hypothetical protein M8J75_012470 [Diaphorina citri]|nr:hypothetical protein M8J75_012470 [Diaphorina citri]
MLGPHQFGAPHPPFSHFGAPRLLSPAPNTSFPSHPRAFLYWPYPSPPVSPTMYIMPGNPPPPHQPTHPMHHSIDWNMDFLAPSHPHMSPFPPVLMGGMYSAAA